MSRSRRKVYKSPVACVSPEKMTRWKEWSRKVRRTRQRQAVKNIDVEEAKDGGDETFFPEKFQHDMCDTTDWSGPHDGYFYRHANKKKLLAEGEEKFWKYSSK